MTQTIFTTERLCLRKMGVKDKDHLLEIFSDPVAMRYYPSTKNSEETDRWIQWTIDNYYKFGVGLWIVEDKQTGEFLGQCGIVAQKVDGKMEMEIGYLLTRRVWGNGYATEAAAGCLEYGFKRLKLPRLISLIDPKNIPSIKVAERIGMTKEKKVEKFNKCLNIYSISID